MTPGVEYNLVTFLPLSMSKVSFHMVNFILNETYHEPVDGYSSDLHGYLIMTGLKSGDSYI